MFGFLRNKYVWLITLLVLLSLLLMKTTAGERQTGSPMEILVRSFYTPLQQGVNDVRLATNETGRYFVLKNRLWNENAQMKRQLDQQLIENQELRELRAENRQFRKMLDFRDQNTKSLDLISAEVIARNPSLWYKTITLDKGIQGGIRVGMVVITPDGLVGRVVSANPSNSQVLLITDRDGSVGAVVQESRTQGIVEGTGDGTSLQMVQLPFYAKFKKGDRVVTSKYSEVYPPGLLIGKVGVIRSERSGILKTATIEPSVNFDKIEEVFVIRKLLLSLEDQTIFLPPPKPKTLVQPVSPAPEPGTVSTGTGSTVSQPVGTVKPSTARRKPSKPKLPVKTPQTGLPSAGTVQPEAQPPSDTTGPAAPPAATPTGPVTP